MQIHIYKYSIWCSSKSHQHQASGSLPFQAELHQQARGKVGAMTRLCNVLIHIYN